MHMGRGARGATALVAIAWMMRGGAGCEEPSSGAPVQVVPPATVTPPADGPAAAPPPGAFEPTFDVADLFDLAALSDPAQVQVSLKPELLGALSPSVWTATFTFRSQVWHASPWDHVCTAYLPTNPDPAAAGLWVVLHGATLDLEPGVPVEGQFARQVAESLGVPALLVGSLPSHTVLRASTAPDLAEDYPDCFERVLAGGELASCADALTWADEDLRWDLLLPMTRAYLRAMSAATAATSQIRAEAEALASLPTPNRFVLLGGGERGLAAWLAAALDPRVAGVWVGAFETVELYGYWNDVAFDWPDRGGDASEWLARLSTGFGRHWRTLHDPWAWTERLGDRALGLARGTNDDRAPLLARRRYEDRVAPTTHWALAPNYGHGFTAPPLAEAWRAFVARVAGGESAAAAPLRVEGGRVGNAWALTAHADGPGPPAACTLWWASHAGTSPRDYREATWRGEPMDLSSGSAKATLSAAGETAAAYLECRVSGTESAFSAIWASW